MKLFDFNSMIEKDRFSHYLPWVAYDRENKLYYNADGTCGFLLELSPVPFAGEHVVDIIHSMMSIRWPKKTIIQFIIYADPYQTPILRGYNYLRSEALRSCNGNRPFMRPLKEWSVNYCDYLMEHRNKGISSEIPVPFRNFRTFMTAKAPCSVSDFSSSSGNCIEMKSMRETCRGSMKTCNISCVQTSPEILIHWMHRVLNPNHSFLDEFYYNDNCEIRSQIIESDTVIKKNRKRLKIDNWNVKTYTPQFYSEEPSTYDSNLLLGDLGIGNLSQIISPFIYTLNISMEDTGKEIERKSNIVMSQQSLTSTCFKLNKKKQEYMKAQELKTNGENFLKASMTIALFEKDSQRLSQAESMLKSIWQKSKYKLQEEMGYHVPLFISMLPFGLYEKGVKKLGRMRSIPARTIGSIAPIQGDWGGTKTPAMLFLSRRGQLTSLDFFDSSTNYNALIAAQSGSGKSFCCNYIVLNYLSIGSQVFIIDVGGSYKKLSNYLNGQYIQFDNKKPFSLNIFGEITYDMINNDINGDERDTKLSLCVNLLSQMANPSEKTTDYERQLITIALMETYKQLKPNQRLARPIDCIIDVLMDMQADLDQRKINDRRPSDLAVKMMGYRSDQSAGKWFVGPLNIEFDKNLVILELEELNTNKALREVVLLLLMSIIDHKMYFGNRNIRKLVIVDEAWDLLTGANTADFINTGYRRARKYGGSYITITQSLNDFSREQNKEVGVAVLSNSAIKILLGQGKDDITRAIEDKQLVVNDFQKNMLESVHTVPGLYSEMFILTNDYFTLCRLFVDKITQVMFSTSPDLVQYIEDQTSQGVSFLEAANSAVEKGLV
jgi:conjugal transfer ATP-binding protein TraC